MVHSSFICNSSPRVSIAPAMSLYATDFSFTRRSDRKMSTSGSGGTLAVSERIGERIATIADNHSGLGGSSCLA